MITYFGTPFALIGFKQMTEVRQGLAHSVISNQDNPFIQITLNEQEKGDKK
jgi:hypothetical protein